MRLALLLLTGCALRPTPYRFSGPVVSTVTLAPEVLTRSSDVQKFGGSEVPDLQTSERPNFRTSEPLPGTADDRDSVAFALALADHASTADAQTLPPTTPLAVGDLVELPSFTAAVTAVDARGVAEIWYVAHGIVHRGFVDASRPRVKRDADGRVVNTFVAHDHDLPPPGTKDLAGEMLVDVLRWPRARAR